MPTLRYFWKYLGDSLKYLNRFAGHKITSIYAKATPNLDKYQKENLELFCQGKIVFLEDFYSLALVSTGKQHVILQAGQDKGHKSEMLA